MKFRIDKSHSPLARLSISIHLRQYFPDRKGEKLRAAKDAIPWFFRKVKN
jgi:hypothetical protein